MARIKLHVTKRRELGSSNVRRLRNSGIIPGIIYGKGKDPIPIKVNIRDIHGIKGSSIAENILLDLVIKDRSEEITKTVIVKELQKDPIKGDWLHIDFNEISLKERLRTKVPIELTGDAVGVTQGGILEQIMHELEIECLPVDIPSHISVDITNLSIGQTIYVKDVTVSDRITVLTNPQLPIVSVSAPKAEEEVAVAPAEGEPTEPEVIGKGKKEVEEVVEGEGEKPKEEAKPKEKEEKKKAE